MPHFDARFRPGIAAVKICALALVLLTRSRARADERILFDFGPKFDARGLTVNDGAKLTIVPEGHKDLPHVATDHSHPWPGIELPWPLPVGHWDLSVFFRVECNLRNPTDRDARGQSRRRRHLQSLWRRDRPGPPFFCNRFAWMNPAAARYCDVVRFNIYHRSLTEHPLAPSADVPDLIGEFHLGALDRGMFHPGLVPVENQADRAAAYKGYLRAGLRDDRMVGCHSFQFGDEPTTGRFYDGENYQIGFIDVADTPYAETVQAAREVGDEM